MKNLFGIALLLGLSLAGQVLYAQGIEYFTNFPETGSSYNSGTFTGSHGTVWTYTNCCGDKAIVSPSPTLGKNTSPAACLQSGVLHNGCSLLKFCYKQASADNVNLGVYINDVQVGTVTTSGQQNIINDFWKSLQIDGDFVITFKQLDSVSSGEVTIDNLYWDELYTNIVPGEPNFYPEAFKAVANGMSVTATWNDVEGSGMTMAYANLLKISTDPAIIAPVDSVPESDDLDLSDGKGTVNVLFGKGTFTFENLEPATIYYLKIYPYAYPDNGGNYPLYKTNGFTPSAQVLTQTPLFSYPFDNELYPWTEYSVSGEQVWMYAAGLGNENTGCILMNGNSAGNRMNQDWLISPSLDLSQALEPKLRFYSALDTSNGNLPLSFLISSDYSGGDPSINGTWTDVSQGITLSPGSMTWTPAGYIDLLDFKQPNIHIAFRYNSTTEDAPVWAIDDVMLTFTSSVGIEEPAELPFALKIYPNPCNDVFFLNILENGNYFVRIVDITGRQILSRYSREGITAFDMKSSAPGIYLVVVSNSGTGESCASRIIVR